MSGISRDGHVYLHQLLEDLPNATVSGSSNVAVGAVAYDSRQVTPGSLFVAVPSVGGPPDSGGVRYIREAVQRGAVGVVVEQPQAVAGVTTVHVPNARAALADLACAFFDHPSRHLQLFAITGTDGKTTATYLLEQVFRAAGRCTGLIGTVEVKVGDRRERNLERMTTPESVEVQRTLREMVDAGVTHVAIEASSHALALERLRGSRFAACGLTNITADHVEFHGSWEAYFQAKARLFTDLGRARPAVLNRDDEHFQRLRPLVAGPVVTYGLGPDADLTAVEVVPLRFGSRCTVRWRGQESTLHVPLPGRFNVSNALAAAGLALTAGLSLDDVAHGLRCAQPPPGRMQRVTDGQPFEVLVDYAHTVNGFRSALAAVRACAPSPHRLIAVFGATGNRDRAKRPQLARTARQYADFVVITNEDPFDEEPEAIIAEVAAGLPPDEEGSRFLREADRAQAIRMAIERARPGDVVVILGKGHEQSIVKGGCKDPWSDVDAVHAALEAVVM